MECEIEANGLLISYPERKSIKMDSSNCIDCIQRLLHFARLFVLLNANEDFFPLTYYHLKDDKYAVNTRGCKICGIKRGYNSSSETFTQIELEEGGFLILLPLLSPYSGSPITLLLLDRNRYTRSLAVRHRIQINYPKVHRTTLYNSLNPALELKLDSGQCFFTTA